jgi:hypothetical protein
MSAAPDNFAAWACDPKRSLEERFGAEILIEQTIGLWRTKHGVKHETNYKAEQLRKKERLLNPAYEPSYSAEAAAGAAEVLNELKNFNRSDFDDRPLRDVSFLRFCPPLDSFIIRKAEVLDWSPLQHHLTLTKLDIWDAAARDLRVISRLTKLETLHLWLGWPWPDLAGLENLTQLRELHFHGNILALHGVPSLPQVRVANIEHGHGFNVPFRSLKDLPAMPELRRLKLINAAELDGCGRFPNLLNLDIYGYFADLNPLTELKNLTHLFVSGGEYPDIAPLARMPKLYDLVIRHDEPPDFTPLADAPCLHEIRLELSEIIPPELAAMNAMLAPWTDEFAVNPPRPLAPLKLLPNPPDWQTEKDNRGVPRDYGENEGMGTSEARWFAREINRRLNALLGKGWGNCEEQYARHPGNDHVTICRPEDMDRIPEIVQCLRQLLASTRHPWSYLLVIDTDRWYERDVDDIYASEGVEFNPEAAREEWEDDQRRARERKEYLERKYRHRLQQELGTPVNPDDFAPPPPPAKDEGDTIAAGHDAPPEPPAYDLGTDISVIGTLTERAFYCHQSSLKEAAYLLGLTAEG